MHVFGKPGLYIDTNANNDYSYVVIKSLAGSNSQKLMQTVFLKAPITGIKIERYTDTNIARSLGGNFGITVFQNPPVYITLDGCASVSQIECDYSYSANTRNIDSFFNEYNISNFTKKGNAIKLSITINKTTYTGYLLQFTTSGSSQNPFIMGYRLTFICDGQV